MTSIPYFSLDRQQKSLEPELSDTLARVMHSGVYVLGPEVRSFESEFAAYSGTQFAIGTGNGLDALTLILMALDITPGDEVIVPANTYFATWSAVSRLGARPVPVDPEPGSVVISAPAIARSINARTKAIIAVHLYGFVCEMDPILELARKHGINVVEDNAQGHGGKYKLRLTGGLARAAATSFYPTKNLGCAGDGGMVTTSDPGLAEKIRVLRNYGSPQRDMLTHIGLNSRLDELQAALLRLKLPHLPQWVENRQRNASIYRELLTGVGDIEMIQPDPDTSPAYHIFPIYTAYRKELQEYLRVERIGTLIHYPVPPHHQPVYQFSNIPQLLPVAEDQARRELSLPVWAELTADEVAHVATVIRRFFDHHL